MDPLESREPLVVALAVGRAHAVLALVAEEVDVDASARVGLHRVEEVARPGDVPVGLGIVLGPDRVDVDVVGGVPLAVRGRVFGHARERAAELEDDACTSVGDVIREAWSTSVSIASSVSGGSSTDFQ